MYIIDVVLGKNTKLKQARTGYLFTLPVFLYIIFMLFVPLVYVLYISTHKWGIRGLGNYVGFEKYIKLINDPIFIKSLFNTFTFTFISVPLIIFFGLIAALAFQSRFNLLFRNYFKTLFFIPLLVSLVAVALVWQWLFNPSIGLLNDILRSFGLEEQGWLNDPNQVLISLSIMHIWARLGFSMVVFIAGLEGIPDEYYEAATIDGANRFQKLWHVTIPFLNPQFVLVIIFEMIIALRTFELPYIATSGGPVNASRTIVFDIYDKAFKYFKMNEAAAESVILFILILTLTLCQRLIFTKKINF